MPLTGDAAEGVAHMMVVLALALEDIAVDVLDNTSGHFVEFVVEARHTYDVDRAPLEMAQVQTD